MAIMAIRTALPHDMPRPSQVTADMQEESQLARRIEEASLNAWPALQQVFLDSWVLRFSTGFTKRANSIVPLYPSSHPDSTTDSATDSALHHVKEKIRYCENLYAREQLQTVFRLTSISHGQATPVATHPANSAPAASEPVRSALSLDEILSLRGYRLDETSLVLSKALQVQPLLTNLKLLSLKDWLSVYCELTGMPEPARTLHNIILQSIAGECAFAVLYTDEHPVACGLGVIERELVGLFDIFTHPDQRNHGYGTDVVQGLLAWAAQQGAQRAYLQMVAENKPAAALYESLGFSEIYRYWYRIGT